ncbi:RNA guanine-N7 methyltransferase activating subunit-like [Mastacembelus armatus]|uniref:RNA guanine-7 methyltransferase activating subunit n=1 Tax=Mastacembelus armatus TaxID=205130 RepID=A0A3Q3LP73_9TELE|nr:RNA guanine-N7 methyltransferase activating subunit [Mastacembelus armatus]
MTDTTDDLRKYEQLFAHRFSAEDHEYQQYLSRPADPPPVVEDWRGRGGGNQRGRDNRYQDRGGHRGRGWGGGGGGQGWRRDHHHWRDRDRDRHWGHGSGYHSGPPNSNQGYNSYNQRSHEYR